MNEPLTIPALFLSTVERLGPPVPLRKKELGLWRDITWNEYAKTVSRVTLGLISLGFQKGAYAAIIGENSPDRVFADIGIMCADGVATGIYTTNAAAQCEYVVQDSGARFYFAENEEQLDKVLAFRERTPQLEKIIVWDMEGLHHFRDPMVISWSELLEMGQALAEKEPD